ncbi:MAG TPA: hypothetical protein VJP80_03150 [Candidatus Saccharimonadales bacterium]|nr:hypothetical protein [Candidatus Saccharimonadales bacterium]
MNKSLATNREAGGGGVLITMVVFIVLFVGAAGFGLWAFLSRQDYKNNSDQKAAVVAASAVQKAQASDAAQYAEEAKSPLKTYVGPSQYGSVTIKYPKTWSAYVIEDGAGSMPVNNYFQPNVVPNVNTSTNTYALRVQVLGSSYDQVLAQFSSAVQAGRLTVKPYSLPKVSSVTGSRLDGQLSQTKQGSMIILPVRNVTLEISTEANTYESDFNNIILANLSFSP